jgi:hypothetical protein
MKTSGVDEILNASVRHTCMYVETNILYYLLHTLLSTTIRFVRREEVETDN